MKVLGALVKIFAIFCFAFGTVLALWGMTLFDKSWEKSTYMVFAAGVLYAVGTIFILVAPSPTEQDRIKKT